MSILVIACTCHLSIQNGAAKGEKQPQIKTRKVAVMDKKGKSEDAEKGYDFSKAISSQKQFRFGARDSNTITVDVSLANLFQRLTVECR